MVGLLFFIPFCCCCDQKLQQTLVRGMQAGRAPQKSRLAVMGRRPSLHGCSHIVLHHGPCNAWASKAQLQRQQNTARIYKNTSVAACCHHRELGARGAALSVDVEESIIVCCSWSSSVPSLAIDTNHSADTNSGFGSLFRQKGPIVACSGEGLPAGACLAIARQVRSSASYRRRDRVHLGLPPFL